jgi:hypothetical protein
LEANPSISEKLDLELQADQVQKRLESIQAVAKTNGETALGIQQVAGGRKSGVTA